MHLERLKDLVGQVHQANEPPMAGPSRLSEPRTQKYLDPRSRLHSAKPEPSSRAGSTFIPGEETSSQQLTQAVATAKSRLAKREAELSSARSHFVKLEVRQAYLLQCHLAS